MRSYGTYNCKAPKKIKTVRIIGPVRIIGTLEYALNVLVDHRDPPEPWTLLKVSVEELHQTLLLLKGESQNLRLGYISL